MKTYRNSLLSATVIPLAVGAGIGLAGLAAGSAAVGATEPASALQTAGRLAQPATPPLPRATPREVQVAACNPCAAKGRCNPCAAKKAASKCNPCGAKNPCAAKGACNPCAVKKAASKCNPCAAKNPCNPCAAKNPCNPCAAGNPCNPCGGASAAVSKRCVVPRLVKANPCAAKNPCAARNPCNPCAAKARCNPCAAKAPCNPCTAKNPCAAKNPCNPCAAGNPCNPCGAGGAVKLTGAEAAKAYDCIVPELVHAYQKSGHPAAMASAKWRRYNRVTYPSSTHGGRFVNNYANDAARAYGAFEKSGKMPKGAVLAKDSFSVTKGGHISIGPLFLMEKMGAGFNKASGDWRYTMIMPDGSIFGTTNGKGSAKMKFCAECHAAVGETQDHMFFLPAEYRVK